MVVMVVMVASVPRCLGAGWRGVQANMGALVSTIMLTALFAMPLAIGKEEWIRFYGDNRAPTCDELNLWGLDNATVGVKIGAGACLCMLSCATHLA